MGNAPKSFKRKQGYPAEVFAPGVFIEEEMEERGWTKYMLAKESGMKVTKVAEIIKGHQRITKLSAFALAGAFGVSYEFWLNLQRAWDERDTKKLREYKLRTQ